MRRPSRTVGKLTLLHCRDDSLTLWPLVLVVDFLFVLICGLCGNFANFSGYSGFNESPGDGGSIFRATNGQPSAGFPIDGAITRNALMMISPRVLSGILQGGLLAATVLVGTASALGQEGGPVNPLRQPRRVTEKLTVAELNERAAPPVTQAPQERPAQQTSAVRQAAYGAPVAGRRSMATPTNYGGLSGNIIAQTEPELVPTPGTKSGVGVGFRQNSPRRRDHLRRRLRLDDERPGRIGWGRNHRLGTDGGRRLRRLRRRQSLLGGSLRHNLLRQPLGLCRRSGIYRSAEPRYIGQFRFP